MSGERAPIRRFGQWTLTFPRTHGWAVGAYFVRPATGPEDFSVTVRCGRRSLSLMHTRKGQPWPDVPECHEPRPHICSQHDPTHGHTWKSGTPSHPGGMIPVRCVVCGARKCDDPRCQRERHHREHHTNWTSYVRPIGSAVSS